MKDALSNPCERCPFLRTASPGYLGASLPEEFAQTTIDHEENMPCHLTVDYDDDDEWKENLHKARRCRGSLIFLRNMCKLPHDSDLAAAVKETSADRSLVFSHRQEFLDHHNNRNQLKPKKKRKAKP